MTEEPVIIEVPLPGPELSPNARVHWSSRWRAAKSLEEWVIVGARQGHTATVDPAVVSYHVRWCGHPPDEDNFVASMKAGLDALVHENVLVDDGPDHVKRIDVSYERVANRKDACVRITVSPCE